MHWTVTLVWWLVDSLLRKQDNKFTYPFPFKHTNRLVFKDNKIDPLMHSFCFLSNESTNHTRVIVQCISGIVCKIVFDIHLSCKSMHIRSMLPIDVIYKVCITSSSYVQANCLKSFDPTAGHILQEYKSLEVAETFKKMSLICKSVNLTLTASIMILKVWWSFLAEKNCAV